jgi:nicotinate-nucleotide pyrophosphorylase (carboxylating)
VIAVWKQGIERIVDAAVGEDLAGADVTTDALVPADQEGKAFIVAKADGVLAGTAVAAAVFKRVDGELELKGLVSDGAKVHAGDRLAVVEGKVASILKGERVALNFLQRLSGIATETARYVEAVSGTKAVITDTRKTTPGLRALEKYAVVVGGGRNHRQNLSDGVLIKDNHLAVLGWRGIGLREAIDEARRQAPANLDLEVEVETVDQAWEAVAAGADIIMLDNMCLEDMQQVVGIVQGRALLEASGGMTLDKVRAVAETGVDLISVGALTHSVRALDISLELEP